MDAIRLPRVIGASTLLLGLMLVPPALAQQETTQQGKAQSGSVQRQKAQAPSAAAGSVESMTARYPKGAINSEASAEQAQVDVRSLRSALADQLASAKNACYDRFFTNSCIDSAKEIYRAAMDALRPIELEANAFLRQAQVDKRDKALDARRLQEEAEAPDRLRIAQENEQKAAQRAQARAQQESERQARQARDAEREAHPDERVQRHEEKMKRLREDDARKEAERSKKIAAYEEKRKAAAERQRKVAERKAEKQAKQAKKTAQPVAADKPAAPAAGTPDSSQPSGGPR